MEKSRFRKFDSSAVLSNRRRPVTDELIYIPYSMFSRPCNSLGYVESLSKKYSIGSSQKINSSGTRQRKKNVYYH